MSNALPPAQLFIGDKNTVHEHAEFVLKQHLCKHAGTQGYDTVACFCSECRKIKNRQHHAVIWIAPEKDYVIADIETIFEHVRFTLDPHQKFFFVLENAHTLTPATANRLLKILEEPPTGYHFILTALNAQAIIPTIVSRCIQKDLRAALTHTLTYQHPLLMFFLDAHKRADPLAFEQELKKQHLTDTQSTELVHQLMATIVQQLRTASTKKAASLSVILEFLVKQLRKPPQSGSSDIFWKNMFLSFPHEIP